MAIFLAIQGDFPPKKLVQIIKISNSNLHKYLCAQPISFRNTKKIDRFETHFSVDNCPESPKFYDHKKSVREHFKETVETLKSKIGQFLPSCSSSFRNTKETLTFKKNANFWPKHTAKYTSYLKIYFYPKT